jgi:hypothetical protein
MTFLEWLGIARILGPAKIVFTGIKGGYQRVVGTAPEMNFEPSDTGLALRISNTRSATIIVENVEASPPLLGFSHGDSVEDIARAVIAQRGAPRERPLLVVKPCQSETVAVMSFDPFGHSEAGQLIKVTMIWRDAERGWFSESRVTRKVAVKDIRDLQQASERRRPRRLD